MSIFILVVVIIHCILVIYNILNVVKILLGHNADCNASDNWGITGLIVATQYGYKDIVELLLQYGADTNARDYIYGRSGQDWAKELNYTEISKLLPESKTDDNSEFWQYFMYGCITLYNKMKQVMPQRLLKLF